MGASVREHRDRDVTRKIPTAPRVVIDERDTVDHRRQATCDPLADDTATDDRDD